MRFYVMFIWYVTAFCIEELIFTALTPEADGMRANCSMAVYHLFLFH
jgi:hypothetical protein